MTGEHRDVTAYRDLLAGAMSGPQTVALLSDEEIVAMYDGTPDALTVLPWIDADPSLSRSVAAQFGARSLLLRGIVRSSGESGHELAVPALLLALSLRRHGSASLRASSTSGDDVHLSVSVQPEMGVLEESVTRGGIHAFTVATYDDSRRRTASWILGDGGSDALVGRRQRMRVADWPTFVRNEIGTDVRLVEVETLVLDQSEDGRPDTWQVAAGHDLAVVARVEAADPDICIAEATSVEHLTQLLADVIQPPR